MLGELSINDIVNGSSTPPTTEEHSWTRGTGEDIDTFTCSHCNKTFQMGEVLSYEPDSAAGGVAKTTQVLGTNSGLKSLFDDYLVGKNEEEREALITSLIEYFGTDASANQTITQDLSLQWIVLGIADQNNDGNYETLLLTSATPTSNTLALYGAAAYNNGPTIMKDVCEDLYSSSTYGTARSMTIEDVNTAVGWTDTSGIVYPVSGNPYKVNAGTKLNEINEADWNAIKANGTKTPDGTNTESKLGSYPVDGYDYSISDVANITTIENATIFGNGSYGYWMASRTVIARDYRDGVASFGLGFMMWGQASSSAEVFGSDGCSDGGAHGGLRPVVSLTSSIPETTGNIYSGSTGS